MRSMPCGGPIATRKILRMLARAFLHLSWERDKSLDRFQWMRRGPPMRKLISAYLLGAMTVCALGNAFAQSIEARELIQATNADRAQHGLGPLKWDPALARAAQRHAELMVGQRALSHQYGGEADLDTRV